MNPLAHTLIEKIETRTARAGVMGLGCADLPLAVELGGAGLVTAEVAALRRAGRLDATADFSVIGALDTVNICVPAPLRTTQDPDTSHIVAAAEQIAKHPRAGMLVVLESTTYPGTTAELLLPMFESTRLKAGRDVFLACSFERADPANQRFSTRNTSGAAAGPHVSRLGAPHPVETAAAVA